MLDPEHDLLPQSSPTISSVSSSDLDTESTGSFFHDRSTTLGTLMGVSFPAITARVPSERENNNNVGTAIVGDSGGKSKGVKKSNKKKAVAATTASAAERRRMKTRRRWWKLCRDDSAMPASLGDFLEVERRFGDGAFYAEAAELENVMPPSSATGNGRVLFADGRVLPPSQTEAPPPTTAGPLCRLPVLLTGICTGGGG